MQAIVETLFDAVYLTSVIAIGVTMIVKSRGNKEYWLFGIMAVVLGAGDAFHLVPRALALCTTGLENFIVPLGMSIISSAVCFGSTIFVKSASSASLYPCCCPGLLKRIEKLHAFFCDHPSLGIGIDRHLDPRLFQLLSG